MQYEINKIYNENSYQAIKKIEDNTIDCIYTDIPYLYDNSKNIKNKNEKSSLSKRITKNSEEISFISDGINYEVLKDFVRVMKKINIFIWCSKKQILDIMDFFITKYDCNFEILTWCKTNPAPSTNGKWLPDIEYCLYFREKGVILNDGYKNKSKFFISPINKNDKDMYDHPTIKPLELVKKHLLHATKENDLVADFFIGSGTTAVACSETNRNFLGFELHEKYFKIAQDRLNGISSNGQTSIFTDFNKDKEDAL